MRADREPWLVPMRMALFRDLHFSTSGLKVCTAIAGSGYVLQSAWRACATRQAAGDLQGTAGHQHCPCWYEAG